ncbi:sulfite exporter TauE/SafE family protein [Bifidobacterium eulemuris]|uniref:Probable membrane transporter protein n=1 Tax=Bifidobacterium eulemuris TaxID=1765219 RepID=A0A261GF73_9BIFI|nr:sulfite exporter TauE/SafE family protein [Bifidobacterium eulemuris]OZG69665.1 sulfite exporter TauE/SafE [Bifidobacterium eulemuris]QOL32226.1 sulfite exporter TauE/SafE family protein [Bifidobacterium eulemuris]
MAEITRDILFLLVLFVSNMIQAITGFAGTVLAMPASMMLIGADEARVVLNAMALVSCLWLGMQHRRHIRWRELIRMVGLMMIGMVAGMLLYRALPLAPLQRAYGLFIIAVALKNLLFPSTREPRPWLMTVILLASGVIHGLFVSGGALLVVYAAARLKDKDEFRATVACVWVVLNTVMGAQQVAAGEWTPHAVAITVIGLPMLALAVLIGNHLQRRISQQAFLTLTYALLVVSGISILF